MAEWAAPGYTRLKELGSGGFGDVVLARHDASGTLVAIKYLRGSLLADAEFVEMFRGDYGYLDEAVANVAARARSIKSLILGTASGQRGRLPQFSFIMSRMSVK